MIYYHTSFKDSKIAMLLMVSPHWLHVCCVVMTKCWN